MAVVMVLFSCGGAHLASIATKAGNATPCIYAMHPPSIRRRLHTLYLSTHAHFVVHANYWSEVIEIPAIYVHMYLLCMYDSFSALLLLAR